MLLSSTRLSHHVRIDIYKLWRKTLQQRLCHGSKRDLWQLLPTELRIEVYKNVLDLPTLRNLLVAVPEDRNLYCRYEHEIWEGALRNESPTVRDSISSLRRYRQRLERECGSVSDLLASELKAHVKHNHWPPLQSYTFTNQIASLFILAELAENVERFAQSFAQRILISSSQPNGKLSRTESHRARRAFWRFLQHYNLKRFYYHRGDVEQSDNGAARFMTSRKRYCNADPGKDWLCRNEILVDGGLVPYYCQDFEINELTAICGFLRDKVSSAQLDRETKPDMYLKQPLLIQTLIRDLEFSSSYASHVLLTMDISVCLRLPRYWSPPSSLRRVEQQANLGSDEASLFHQQRKSLGEKHDWSWCLWDRDRLLKCGMLCCKNALPYWYPTETDKIAWLRKTRKAHERYATLLKSTTDHRIDARFDADVTRGERKALQRKELQQRRDLVDWVRGHDPLSYNEWLALTQFEDFDREAQKRANLFYSKALLSRKLMDCLSKESGILGEEADLEFLGYYQALATPFLPDPEKKPFSWKHGQKQSNQRQVTAPAVSPPSTTNPAPYEDLQADPEYEKLSPDQELYHMTFIRAAIDASGAQQQTQSMWETTKIDDLTKPTTADEADLPQQRRVNFDPTPFAAYDPGSHSRKFTKASIVSRHVLRRECLADNALRLSLKQK
ncbi:MAG: hypothetical protein Q9218_001355 [Villophora microphyllina]